MAEFLAPSYASLKRKRSVSSQIPSHLPPEAINPFSYSQALLGQFAVAGLTDRDVLPDYPKFPHKPLPEPQADEDDHSGEQEDEGADERPRQPQLSSKPTAQQQALAPLRAIVLRYLQSGDIARAKRAFGLALRTSVGGKQMDLRADYWWALGAEILMREGETPATSDERSARRWGTAANTRRVQRYYQDLIQLFPYDRLRPGRVDALTFWPVMLGVEMYDVYVEERSAKKRVEDEIMNYDEDDEMDLDGHAIDDNDDEPRLSVREARVREGKEEIREVALEQVTELAKRMDNVMADLPYSRSHEMLRLRGMVALYMSDLVMPTMPRRDEEEHEGLAKREVERERAKDKFRRMIKNGGEVEEWIEYFVFPERKHRVKERQPERPLFSSLPIRPPL